MRWLVLWVVLAGCGEGGYSIDVRFASSALQESVTRIRIRLLLACNSNALVQEKELVWEKNSTKPRIGSLEPGRYGVEVVGYEVRGDEVCQVARECVAQSFEAGGKKTVLVTLQPLTTPVCMPINDAGVDAGTREDASEPLPDGGTCKAADEVCNNEDDDCDREIDEETDKDVDRENCGTCGNICEEGSVCGGLSCAPPIVQIAPGGKYTCARRADGQVLCWGDNTYGQLGDGTYETRLVPVPASDLTDAVELGSGKFHACALRKTGEVVCWGDNSVGELARNFGTTIPTPTAIEDVDSAVSLGLGFYHVCVVVEGGDVVCWGSNNGGQLGRPSFGDTDFQRNPMAVSGVHNAEQVDGGWRFTCARLSNGTVSCWGYNDHGQLGDGTTTNRVVPAIVETESGDPLGNVVSMGVGLDHVCVLQRAVDQTEGAVLCWGGGEHGQLGDGSNEIAIPAPVATGIEDAVEVAIGSWFTCARSADGEAKCWGKNDWGQLGDGTVIRRNTPTPVVGLTNTIHLYVDNGDYHGCAVRDDLVVVCWGRNETGQLGTGTMETSVLSPVRARRI